MSNTFIVLDVPVATGAGVASDVSGLGEKTVLIEGVPPGIGPFAGALLIEGSQDGGVSFVPLASIQIPVDPPKIVIPEYIQLIRVRRDNVSIGVPAPIVTLGAENVSGAMFATFAVTAGDGAGAAIATSTFPTLHTVLTSGNYRGSIIIEASMEAAGENFDPVAELDAPGFNRVSFAGAFARMRVRREASGLDPGTPIVTLGSGPASSGDSSSEFLTETLTNSSGAGLVEGNVVRISANNAVTLAQGNNAASAQGTIGVAGAAIANGAQGPFIISGKGRVLMQAGLPGVAAGQTLWVSPTVAGRATNVKPSGAGEAALCLGIVKDTTGITNPTGANDLVTADIDADCEPTTPGLVASIQCGKEPLTNQTTKAVVFPVAFASPPSVVLTPLDQADVTVTANLDAAPTAAGFTIRMSAAYTGTVHWIACLD